MEQIPLADDQKTISGAGNGISEGAFGAISHHQNNQVAAPGLQNDPLAHSDIDEKNRRCRNPRCDDKPFKSIKDLKRHAKMHDSNSVQWFCGCCQNLRDPFRGNTRKDKVQTHQRNIHGNSGSKSSSITCPVEHCYTLFTAPSCIDIHLRKCHPDQVKVITSQPTNGKQSFY